MLEPWSLCALSRVSPATCAPCHTHTRTCAPFILANPSPAGYKRLFKSLAQSGGTPESLALIQTHLSSLLSTISTAIKNPTYPTEQYAACRILEVVSLILGPDRDDYYDEIAPILTRILNSASSAPMVKSGALRAASMSAFFNSTDMSTTVELGECHSPLTDPVACRPICCASPHPC